jgi:hypothetical protein
LVSASVPTMVASASTLAVWEKNEAGWAAHTPGRRRVGQALHAEGVQEHPVPPAQLDVLQAPPAAQGVVGDVQHVVGLVVGTVGLEQPKRRADLFCQPHLLDQAGDQAHAAGATALERSASS